MRVASAFSIVGATRLSSSKIQYCITLIAAMGLRCDTSPRSREYTYAFWAGTIAHRRPWYPKGRHATYTRRRYSYRRAQKNCLVSQSRHLRPSSRFAEIAKRNAHSGWLPIVANQGRPSQGCWKHYGGTCVDAYFPPYPAGHPRVFTQTGDFCALYLAPFNPLTAIICNNLCFRCFGYAWP